MDCEASGCERKAHTRSLCQKHYKRLIVTGTTELLERPRKTKAECAVDGCSSLEFCRKWCRKHYTRWYETGSLELGVRKNDHSAQRRPIEERFWAKVLKGENHWLWTGQKTKLGYGSIWSTERQAKVMAHRLSWEIANGRRIPDGMVIDHLCRTPSCVNPSHLEVVTVSINTARGLAGEVGGRRNRIKTHCPQGHPYSLENTYYYSDGKRRVCRTCSIERTQERRRRLAAAR